MAGTKLLALSLAGSAAMLAGAAIAEPVASGGKKLSATLTGAAEVPGPGDPDGSGTATVTVNAGQNRLCYRIEVSNIAPATAAHIHIGAPNQAGPISLGLATPSDGDSEGCEDIPSAFATALIKSPGVYYVNVHNADFPAGAVRGQLGKQ